MSSSRERSPSQYTRRYTWEYVELLVGRVQRYVETHTENIKTIAAIARGGLMPGVMLSHRLNMDFVAVNHTEHICRPGEILLLDEICDTGMAFCNATQAVHSTDGGKIWLMSLVAKSWSPPIDFYSILDDAWIVFPWENE